MYSRHSTRCELAPTESSLGNNLASAFEPSTLALFGHLVHLSGTAHGLKQHKVLHHSALGHHQYSATKNLKKHSANQSNCHCYFLNPYYRAISQSYRSSICELGSLNIYTHGWPKGHPLQISLPLIIWPLDCDCLLYTSPSPRDRTRSRMPSSA